VIDHKKYLFKIVFKFMLTRTDYGDYCLQVSGSKDSLQATPEYRVSPQARHLLEQ